MYTPHQAAGRKTGKEDQRNRCNRTSDVVQHVNLTSIHMYRGKVKFTGKPGRGTWTCWRTMGAAKSLQGARAGTLFSLEGFGLCIGFVGRPGRGDLGLNGGLWPLLRVYRGARAGT